MIDCRSLFRPDGVMALPCVLAIMDFSNIPISQSITVLLHPSLEPPHGLSDVDLATTAWNLVHNLG